MKTSRSDVRRMMSEAVKQAGPEALWCGLKSACLAVLFIVGDKALWNKIERGGRII